MKRKKLTDILSTMIDRILINTHELNDFTPGSITRTILESVALEIEMLYTLTKQNIKKGIETGIYEAFDFNRREARRAYGDIQITFHTAVKNPTVISRGTKFFSTIPGYEQSFETTQEYLIPAGTSQAFIEVYSTTPGTSGNIPKNILNASTASQLNIESVRNPNAFLTGQDQEPLEDVKKRFREFVDTRGRATSKAISYGVRQVPDISGVHVNSETGRIQVYAHDLNGNLSSTLQNSVERAVEEYRPSGIYLEVLPIVKREVNVSITVTLTTPTARTNAFREEIEESIINYLNTKEVNEDLILTTLVQKIRNIDDYLIYDVKIENPITNIEISNNELIRAGNIAVRFQ